jgi:hypothetical protein
MRMGCQSFDCSAEMMMLLVKVVRQESHATHGRTSATTRCRPLHDFLLSFLFISSYFLLWPCSGLHVCVQSPFVKSQLIN